MVVIVQRKIGNSPHCLPGRLPGCLFIVGYRPIGNRSADHRPGAFHKRCRIDAFFDIAAHILHARRIPGVKPSLQMRSVIGPDRFGCCDADKIEPKLDRPGFYRFAQTHDRHCNLYDRQLGLL